MAIKIEASQRLQAATKADLNKQAKSLAEQLKALGNQLADHAKAVTKLSAKSSDADELDELEDIIEEYAAVAKDVKKILDTANV